MITISNFGWRIGNQMLQIAAAYTLAKENNDEFLCPEWKYQKYFKLKHKQYAGEKIENTYKEAGFHYNKIPYSPNLSLEGYFQSYKYFTPEIFNELFQFENMSLDFNIKGFFNPNAKSCSIHVRRGDYLKYPDHHPLCKEEYFTQAIDIMSNSLGVKNFLVFSDDIEWCRSFFINTANCYFSFSLSSEVSDLLYPTSRPSDP